MAEKEERIGIKIEIYDPCGRCTIKDKCAKNKDPQSFLIDPHSCFQYKLLHRLPTKADVIERMAKALVEYEKTNNQNACEWTDLKERAKDVYRDRAEAALNELLEGK